MRQRLQFPPRQDVPGPPIARGARAFVPRQVPGTVDSRHVYQQLIGTKCVRCGVRGEGICDAIPEDELQRLSAAAHTVRLKPGQRFMQEGDPADYFFTVTFGTARLLKMLPNGRQQITSFADIGDFLGLAVASRYNCAAEAVDELQVCRFSRAALGGLMQDHPAIEARLLEYATHELALAQEQMLLLGRKTAPERVASFLLARAIRSEHFIAGGTRPHAVRVTLPMSRVDIADYLGLRIETVSRAMTQLRIGGTIELVTNADIIIRDLAALQKLGGGATE